MKKNLFSFMLATMVVLTMSSCEELLDVTETFIHTEEFQVAGNDLEYFSTRVVDLAADEDLIADYGDKIKEIQIQKIRYWVKAHSGSAEQALTSGALSVANADGTDMIQMTSLSNQVLQSLIDNPQELPLNQPGIDKFGDLAKNPPHRFMLQAEATHNEVPLNYTVVFELTIKMVANPLN